MNRSSKAPDLVKLLYQKKLLKPPKVSFRRPKVEALITRSKGETLRQITKSATIVGELNSGQLSSTLNAIAEIHDFRKAEHVTKVYREAGKKLTVNHYTQLISIASKSGNVDAALRLWKEMFDTNIRPNEITYGAIVAVVAKHDMKEEAFLLYRESLREGFAPTPHLVHVMLQLIRRGMKKESATDDVDQAIAIFDECVKLGLHPTEVLYVELLRCFISSIRCGFVEGVVGRIEQVFADVKSSKLIRPNAGIYNAGIEALCRAKAPENAMALYRDMKFSSVLSNSETMAKLVMVRKSLNHALWVLKEGNAQALPIHADVYREVFRRLLKHAGAESTISLVKTIVTASCIDAGNANNSLSCVYSGLFDALITCGNAQGALDVLEEVSSMLEPVVGSLTGGVGAVGDPMKKWIVEGVVAVVDASVLFSSKFPTLAHHYDSVIIPISSVRTLVRWAEVGGKHKEKKPLQALKELNQIIHGRMAVDYSMIRVFPLYAQLEAQQRFANSAAGQEEKKLLPENFDSLLLAANEAAWRKDSRSIPIRPVQDVTSPALRDRKMFSAPSFCENDATLRLLENPANRVLSVALRLKMLNPDADVHVVSQNEKNLKHFESFNDKVKAVRFNFAELQQAAPIRSSL